MRLVGDSGMKAQVNVTGNTRQWVSIALQKKGMPTLVLYKQSCAVLMLCKEGSQRAKLTWTLGSQTYKMLLQ